MKNKKMFVSALMIASLTAGSWSAMADDGVSVKPATPRLRERAAENEGPSHSLAAPDAKNLSPAEFLKKAAQGGMMEINLGKVATQRAQDPSVKELGQTLVTDHSKANTYIKKLAQNKKIDLSMEMKAKNSSTMERFSTLTGADFDRAFTSHEIEDHKNVIAMFERASISNEDADVRAFAKNTLPTLQKHLRMAQKCAAMNMKGRVVTGTAGASAGYKSDLTDKGDKLSNDATHPAQQDVAPKK